MRDFFPDAAAFCFSSHRAEVVTESVAFFNVRALYVSPAPLVPHVTQAQQRPHKRPVSSLPNAGTLVVGRVANVWASRLRDAVRYEQDRTTPAVRQTKLLMAWTPRPSRCGTRQKTRLLVPRRMISKK